MVFCSKLPQACAFLLLAVSAFAESGPRLFVRSLSMTGNNPFQLRIQTTGRVTPQLQIVPSPERLVIDLPNARPGVGLHGLVLNGAEVRGVRVGVFSAKPLITRVVVDLNLPHWYRVASDASGLTINLGSDAENAGNPRPMIGWVSGKQPVNVAATHLPPIDMNPHVAPSQPPNPSGVKVQFAGGLITIHANNATLSEILFQVHNTTGAEIAIPSGSEQDRVAADFGPGTPSQVLAQLLDGSGLNFVLVGSQDDPQGLRRVILTHKTGGVDPPRPDEIDGPDTPEHSEPANVAPPAANVAPPGGWPPSPSPVFCGPHPCASGASTAGQPPN